MITISDLYNKEKNTPLIINKVLLQSYKDSCDSCLVNLRRELSRSLVDYRLFQKLQQINNDTFIIIDYLDCEHYTYIKEIEDNKKELVSDINSFLKHCKNCITLDIYNIIFSYCEELTRTIQKLIQIVRTVNEGV